MSQGASPAPMAKDIDASLRKGKSEGAWQYARRCWAHAKTVLDIKDMNVPAWYAGYVGVPLWVLRQKVQKGLAEDRCQQAMLARMSFILDTGFGLPDPARSVYLRSSTRMLPVWKQYGQFPIYNGKSYNLSCSTYTTSRMVGERAHSVLLDSLVRVSWSLVHLCQ